MHARSLAPSWRARIDASQERLQPYKAVHRACNVPRAAVASARSASLGVSSIVANVRSAKIRTGSTGIRTPAASCHAKTTAGGPEEALRSVLTSPVAPAGARICFAATTNGAGDALCATTPTLFLAHTAVGRASASTHRATCSEHHDTPRQHNTLRARQTHAHCRPTPNHETSRTVQHHPAPMTRRKRRTRITNSS